MEQIVEQWFKDNFSVPQVSQTVEIYNVCFNAKEDLKKRLAAAINQVKSDIEKEVK